MYTSVMLMPLISDINAFPHIPGLDDFTHPPDLLSVTSFGVVSIFVMSVLS